MSSPDIDNIDDRLLLELERLAPYQPDPVRAERVRTRCAATLARRQSTRRRPAHDIPLGLQSTVVAGLCLAYVVGMMLEVLLLNR